MSKKTYFQYQKDHQLPIFVSVDLTQFNSGLETFLNSMQFTKVLEKEEAAVVKILKQNNLSRHLSLMEATPSVARQIEGAMESDRYGDECIVPKSGYQVYRYKNVGLMVYSFGVKNWELGTFKEFGSSTDRINSRIVMNRFLSWALASQGIVGLWGVSVDDAVVLQRMNEAKGEAVFIDVMRNKIFTLDGVKKLGPKFKVLRLDPTLKGRNIKMSSEELLSILSTHVTYFDYAGLSVPVRQMIQTLSKMTEGLIHPQESFRPRTDLSL